MKHTTVKILKTIGPFILGVILLCYVFNKTSAQDRGIIVDNITNTNPVWLLLSVTLGILSHWSRATRWNYLLQPLHYKPKIYNNFFAVLVAYLANLGVPRSGEFLRATTLSTYEKVPFEKGFGTIVTERVIDLIMLLLVIGIALFLQTQFILNYLQQYGNSLLISGLLLIISIIGLVVTLKLMAKAQTGLLGKINHFLQGVLAGVTSILKIKKRVPFILHTLFIWSCYIGMFYVIKFAFVETQTLNLGQLLVAFVAGAFAMMVFPGGFVGYPIFVAAALSLYGVSENTASAFGWVMWITQTAMVVILGAISFVLLPLVNRK